MSSTSSLSLAVSLLLSAIIVVGIYVHLTTRPIYAQEYGSMMLISPQEDVILTGPCVKVSGSIEIKEKTATLSVGHDRMTGKRVKMADSDRLFVEFSDTMTVELVILIPNGYEDIKKNQLLLVIHNDNIFILTNHTDCEEIASLLEQLHDRKL